MESKPEHREPLLLWWVSVIIARSLHAHPASTGLKGERPFLVFTKKQKLYIKNHLPTGPATWSLLWMWVLSKFQELKTKTAMTF